MRNTFPQSGSYFVKLLCAISRFCGQFIKDYKMRTQSWSVGRFLISDIMMQSTQRNWVLPNKIRRFKSYMFHLSDLLLWVVMMMLHFVFLHTWKLLNFVLFSVHYITIIFAIEIFLTYQGKNIIKKNCKILAVRLLHIICLLIQKSDNAPVVLEMKGYKSKITSAKKFYPQQ